VSAAGAAVPATDATTTPFRRLRRAALPADTVALARFLLGQVLVHATADGVLAGRIVETEAYTEDDAASHSFRGRTRRNSSMYLARGHAYVYTAYGVWPALNVASEAPGVGAAVLLRAIEPLAGLDIMRLHRGAQTAPAALARGPGCLTVAMGVTMAADGADLCGAGPLYLAEGTRPARATVTATRIGISRDADLPRRFFEAGNPHVSGPRRLIGG
jgi:DNA-3-methyladenine glycosylase